MLPRFRLKVSLLLIVFCGCLFSVSAQKKTSFLQFYGTVKSGLKNLNGAEIKIYENGNVVQTVQAKDNGSFILMMDLNREYLAVFSKPGYISKSFEVNSGVPADAADIGYTFKGNVELYEDIGDVSKSDPMSKPVAKLAYSATYEEFDFDPVYTKRIQQEQQDALKAAADIKHDRERARLDSLNKAWNDSIARFKDRDARLAAERAALEKSRQDSIARANAAAGALAAAEKARTDSVTRAEAEKRRLDEIARNKAIADSVFSANAQRTALFKAQQDSIAKANLAQKSRLDSITRAEAEKKRLDELARNKARTDSLALAQAELKKHQDEEKARLAAEAMNKVRQDSISKAEAVAARLADAARQKFIADSTTKAQARQKAEADSLAKAKSAEDARLKALAAAQAKATDDSIAKAKLDEGARQRALAESQAKAHADSIAKAKADALEARRKFVADSTAEATANRTRDKTRQDSITRAEANARALAEARKKVEADSIARVEMERQKQDALAKAKAEQDAKAKAEEERQKQLLADKAHQDSLTAAAKAQKEKEDADKKAQLLADIQAKKDALAKANTYDKTEKAPTTAVPKIVSSDYKEGITDEKITESNRNIERTVVKKEGTTYNYQKITYNWGGVFYFKNENSVTSTTFNTELTQARKALNK